MYPKFIPKGIWDITVRLEAFGLIRPSVLQGMDREGQAAPMARGGGLGIRAARRRDAYRIHRNLLPSILFPGPDEHHGQALGGSSVLRPTIRSIRPLQRSTGTRCASGRRLPPGRSETHLYGTAAVFLLPGLSCAYRLDRGGKAASKGWGGVRRGGRTQGAPGLIFGPGPVPGLQ